MDASRSESHKEPRSWPRSGREVGAWSLRFKQSGPPPASNHLSSMDPPPAEPCRFASASDESVLADIGPLLAPPYIARSSVVLGLPASDNWATLPSYAMQQPPPDPATATGGRRPLTSHMRSNFSISSLDDLFTKQDTELNGITSLGIVSSQAGTSTSTRAGGGDQSSLSTRRDSGNISSSPEVLRPQVVFKRQPSSEDVQSDQNHQSSSESVTVTSMHQPVMHHGATDSPPLPLLSAGVNTIITPPATVDGLQWNSGRSIGAGGGFRPPPPPPSDERSRMWSAPVSIEAASTSTGSAHPISSSIFRLHGFNRCADACSGGMLTATGILQPPQTATCSPQQRALMNPPLLPHIFSVGLIAQLRYTVEHYVKRVTPSESERDAKRTLFNAFAEFLRRTLQDRIAISVAGSTAYEVDAKGSDLDVVLLTNLGAPLWVLQHIVNYLSATQSFHKKTGRSNWPLKDVKLQLVQSARVPLLSIATPKGLLCDVSVNTLNSVKHTEYFKRVISCKPQLRPLMRLLKYWAKVRKLPTMKEGGLPGIVWMMITVYFASCPLDTLIEILKDQEEEGSSTLSHPSVASILPACDEAAPLFASLIRFFLLCGNRDSMSRTVSVAQAICRHKSPQEVAQRVRSINNHKGVWDEVVSIEDPATVTEAAPPSEANWNPANTATIHFEPGSTFDLAAKISSATWLTYMLELKRGSMVLLTLLKFIKESQMRVQELPKILSGNAVVSSMASPGNAHACASVGTGGWSPGSGDIGAVFAAAEPVPAEQYIAMKFRHLIAFLFEESGSDRFILPGCDESLRKAETQLVEDGGTLARGISENSLDTDWGAAAISARGVHPRLYFPFCLCCSVPHTTFAVVLLYGRLHVLRILSICTDWTTWWSRDFLSRRDIRSTLHGSLYRVVTPENYPTAAALQAGRFFHSHLTPTGFPQFDPLALKADARDLESNKSPFPTLLIPVKKHATSTPVELFFSPCHFVCRLKAWNVPASSNHPDEGFFYMETDETRYLSTLEGLLKQAPWYQYGNAGSDVAFQPTPESCIRCNIEGDDVSELPESADYVVSDGAFQKSRTPQSQQAIASAWNYWTAHVEDSRRSHIDGWMPPLSPSDCKCHEMEVTRSDSVSSVSSMPHELVVVPQLRDAAGMLVATVDSIQKMQQLRRETAAQRISAARKELENPLPPPATMKAGVHVQALVVRRTRSMPSRVDGSRQSDTYAGNSFLLRGQSIREKRSDLARYVPPSKRVMAAKVKEEEMSAVPSSVPSSNSTAVVDASQPQSKSQRPSSFPPPPPPLTETDEWLPHSQPVGKNAGRMAPPTKSVTGSSAPASVFAVSSSVASSEIRKRKPGRGNTPTHNSAPTTPATVRGRANFAASTATSTILQPRNRRHESAAGTRSSRRNRRGSIDQQQAVSVKVGPSRLAGRPTSSAAGGAMDASRRLLMSALKDTFRGQPSNLDQ
eukprot:Gregarina_sp_Poly_1__1156@NODE_1282_length_4499_cov_162_138538_g868_i0_p1_GENE_NODE_1282_length_4499_cov_162_138538_g868_i0NODE_1282_length_4499_cov_162_138538_g868_i0_p1_ORF_typecomplete_len1454_score203_56PAP_central/PF04928_17/3_4e06NTP_transf_2/PF01909_23/0_083NTP_transf_2/PF01909_23/6_8e03TMEM174/PF15029_6/0_17TMEM174/PF15029_6/38TMEM174/PF15029_6/8_2e03_NODE_1282_length_4499_cov_162_138538_g868_i0774438